MNTDYADMFSEFRLNKKFVLRNRIAMAPMTTWSANNDGTLSDEELAFYRSRATGVGLVITGTTYVAPNGIGFVNQFGGWDDKFIPSLTKLADVAKESGAKAILQVFHAGNRALSNVDVVAATSRPAPGAAFNDGNVIPRSLSHDEIIKIINDFGETVRRAIFAGFDGVELHGAHGFLLQNFLSPLYNQRDDEWGGCLENRMRLPLAIVNEAKKVISEYATKPFILGYRISPEEQEEGGLRINESLQFIDRLIEHDIGYIHGSLNNVLEFSPIGGNANKTTAEVMCNHIHGRVPVFVAGAINTPEDAQQALKLGVDVVAIGHSLVINPDWVELVADGKINEISHELDLSQWRQKSIPQGLINMIDTTKGWFAIKPEPVTNK